MYNLNDIKFINDKDKLDGPLTTITQCIEIIFDTQINFIEPLLCQIEPKNINKLKLLYTAIDNCIWTKEELFKQPIFSKIAFYALDTVKETNQSTVIRFGNVKELIGEYFNWESAREFHNKL